MSELHGFFSDWSARKKLSFGSGIAACLALVLALAWWACRGPKAVLFADLSEQDAAVFVAELDRLKHPYAISEDGRSILVAADTVHKTRMALMGRQLPLHGAVGFELFNNTDFGASDFVQKVNYQRALQGELTRTILAIEQVQDARVHLALPEQQLFRKEAQKAKASVTVTIKGGQSLLGNQVVGIQRLLAASVPEITADEVTVLDQHGVVLSRASGEDSAVAARHLDARQEMEAHLARKAARLLDQLFQPGEALVTVDVVINHEQSRVTTEEVLAAGPVEKGERAAGVISRERSVSKDAGGDAAAAAGPQTVSQETDYQNGKRVAQTVSPGGQLQRLSVAVVVKRSLSEAQAERVRDLMAGAVGLLPSRGDRVSVHSMTEFGTQASLAAPPAAAASGSGRPAAPAARAPAAELPSGQLTTVLAVLLILSALAGALGWALHRRKAAGLVRLNDAEREALLATLRSWLQPAGGTP